MDGLIRGFLVVVVRLLFGWGLPVTMVFFPGDQLGWSCFVLGKSNFHRRLGLH